ncbi:MAG: hypothetical protein IT340_09005 [Chloroflexi bacterium]|nr:hypothetical protein [Chloroflexota bacterium]
MTPPDENRAAANVIARARRVAAERGIAYAARAGVAEMAARLTSSLWWYRVTRSRRAFTYGGRRYRYFFHAYNSTWKTERAVEVPIAREFLRHGQGRRVLEIGNVLSHYGRVTHDIVDKYERAPGVRNIDIVDYAVAGGYALIVSISTLEHVGWDETPRDSDKLPRAMARVRALLAPGGVALLTLPLAYNPAMDAMLRDGRLSFEHRGCLQRISADNRWAEVAWSEIAHARFNEPFRGINGLVVATLS